MKRLLEPSLFCKLVPFLVLISSTQVQAQKVWTSNNSGLWRDTNNWSGHILPDITSFVQITTNNTVTVTIDALTDPANLTIQMLTIGAPIGATNSVLLSDTGTNNPLVLQTGLSLLDGGSFGMTNAALLLQLTNDHVNIDGNFTIDSGLIDFGDITVTARVGRATSGTFTINSGLVSAGAMNVGGLANSSGTLNLNGGTLNVATLFSVGRNPGTTGNVFIAGGQLAAVGEIARIGDTDFGQMTVSNAVVLLTNLNVGRDPLSVGLLTLQNGSSMTVSNEMSIGRFPGSTGSVFVTGGQLAGDGLKLHVGHEGIGQLTISSGKLQTADLLVAADFTNTASGILTVGGGILGVSSTFFVGSSTFSTGQVSVTGGTLAITNTAAVAVMKIPNGSLTLDGGIIMTDALVLTNALGRAVFNAGTLSTKSTTIANGAAFIVGNGTAAATLHLDGGTHSFADGLIISSNATLNGCGTVIGTIVNHGTIATNCGVTPPQLAVSPPSLDFGSVAVGASAQASFVVSNLGGAALTNGAATVSPAGSGFTILSGTPFSLPGFGTTNLVVRFAPGSAGSYTNIVTFTSANGGGSTDTVTGAGALAPAANFVGSPTNGTAPLSVTFTDNSAGSITNRFWDFGDGVTTNTALTNVIHTYTGAGTNTVNLTVTGPLGTNILSRSNYILVTNLLLVRPTISRVVRSGTSVTVFFSSASGQTYTLEFKNLLTDTSWTAILPSTNGNGGVISLSDTAASVPNRCYRLRTQ